MALGFMRRHKRWLYVFLWVVILGFIAFYFPIFRGADAGARAATVARVGDLTITLPEFQRMYLMQRQRYEQIYQGQINEAMLRQMHLEDQVLEGLVTQRLFELEARRLGLHVDDEAVARAISKQPGLQENGRFVGPEEYRRRLEANNRSIEEFEDAVRSSLLQEQLESLVTDGVSVSPAEAEQEFRKRHEQIKAEYVFVDSARFRPQLSVGDDEVKARFEKDKEQYRVPAKRVVSYLLVDTEALKSRVTLTDHDLEAYYKEHEEQFKEPAQACAAHILVKVKATPEAKDGHPDAEAKKIAEGLLAQVKGGADFSALAKKVSEDKGSAEKGGDLGCFGRGRMVPEFDSAVFEMQPGATSELVKSSAFGYHIIRLNSVRPETTRPLAQVKEQIRFTQLGERAQALEEEKAQAVSAALKKGRSLADAAKAEGLSVQTSTPFAAGETVEPLRSQQLVARAFELKPGETDKDGFPLPKGYAFIALAEEKPAHPAELKEVQDKVKADLLEQQALEKARALAEDLKSRAGSAGLDKGGLQKAAEGLGLLRKETPALVGRGQPIGDLGTGVALEDLAYALPEKTLSDPVRAGSGYALVRVLEKKAFDPVAFEKEKASLMASLKEERRGKLFQAYMAQARQRFTIERNAEVYKRIASR